jgi:hypothetical protein
MQCRDRPVPAANSSSKIVTVCKAAAPVTFIRPCASLPTASGKCRDGHVWPGRTGADAMKKSKALLKALPRVVPLDDGRYAVDIEPGVTVLFQHVDGRLLIDVEDGIRLVYWRDAECHVVIERNRQQQKKVAA